MKGSCLCGRVEFTIDPPFKVFQYCHCSRCRKVTGSAHASNIFVPINQFEWQKGSEHVGRFEPEGTKYFATSFCNRCGSSLPWEAKAGNTVIVPAGSLDDDPEMKPQQNIFWESRACWYEETNQMKKFSELPKKSKSQQTI